MDTSNNVNGDAATAQALPRGVVSIADLGAQPSESLGEEGHDLVRLAKSGVSLGTGVRVALGGDDVEGRLTGAVHALWKSVPAGATLVIRPAFPTYLLGERFAEHGSLTVPVADEGESDAAVKSFLTALRAPDLTGALGGSLSRLFAYVNVVDAARVGSAASADPRSGDPELILVWVTKTAPWHVDRRTARVVQNGEGTIDSGEISLASDLVDRVQLVLERPVTVRWTRVDGRVCLLGVRPLQIIPAFTQSPYRIVTLVAADEGTVAPMAIDALDRALSRDDAPSDEPRVRRIYARPYRRQDATDRHRRPTAETSLARVAMRAATVAKDVALPLTAVRDFERGLDARLRALDSQPLGALDDQGLLKELWERQRLAVEAFILLDRHRLATIAVLAALEMTGCAVPRESFPAIARPRHVRSRQRTTERLRRLAEAIEEEFGDLAPPAKLTPTLRRRYDELKLSLANVRPLGIDICPDAIGASDKNMMAALAFAKKVDEEAFKRQRRGEIRKIRATAAERSFGRVREGLASSLVLLQSRVSQSKGVAVEGLAAALLRVRRATTEVGRRLMDAGILDEPEDALYMDLGEIEEALRGDPGAYASRVRLRREDDARWAKYEAPRRIEARRPHG